MARNPRRLQKLVALARPDENSAGFLDWHIVLAICEEAQPPDVSSLLRQLWPHMDDEGGDAPSGEEKVWANSVYEMWCRLRKNANARAFKNSISKPPEPKAA